MSTVQDDKTQDIVKYEMLIDGRWVNSVSGNVRPTTNPYTGSPWATVPEANEQDVDAAVGAAKKAFKTWGNTTAQSRAKLLRKLADLIERDAERLANIESRDNGKLVREMLAQWRYLPSWFNYYAGVAELTEGSTLPSDRPNFVCFTRKEPAGVVAAIAPWNSPALLLCWKMAPALAAGCTFVAKPSEHTPASAIELGKLCCEAGFPDGVYNVITGGPDAGKALVSHTGVSKVAFTGSTEVGKMIAKACADNVTGVLLELGGKSPNIVFEDAEIDAAVNGVISGIFAASGQTCMAGSRLIVHSSVRDEIVSRVVERAKTIKVGDPAKPETEMGPVATSQQKQKICGMISRAVEDGAELACGSLNADADNNFVLPTVLTGVRRDMEIVQEEVFGPVLSVLTFNTEEEALELANDTKFGLAAGVWTRDVRRAHRMANGIKAGTVWINAYRTISYNAPFGGFGQSGLGRENGRAAIEEYLETKTVWIELTGATRDPFTIG